MSSKCCPDCSIPPHPRIFIERHQNYCWLVTIETEKASRCSGSLYTWVDVVDFIARNGREPMGAWSDGIAGRFQAELPARKQVAR